MDQQSTRNITREDNEINLQYKKDANVHTRHGAFNSTEAQKVGNSTCVESIIPVCDANFKLLISQSMITTRAPT